MSVQANAPTEKRWYPTFPEYLRAEYQGPHVVTASSHGIKGEEIVLTDRKSEQLRLVLPTDETARPENEVYVATDILIRYNAGEGEGLVLIDRKHEPYGFCLPGGMAERMTLSANAIKEAKEETGLAVLLDNATTKPFDISSNPNRDPRAFIISVTYTGRGTGTLLPHPDEDANSAFVVPYQKLEQLVNEPGWAFKAHADVVTDYLRAHTRGEIPQ